MPNGTYTPIYENAVHVPSVSSIQPPPPPPQPLPSTVPIHSISGMYSPTNFSQTTFNHTNGQNRKGYRGKNKRQQQVKNTSVVSA